METATFIARGSPRDTAPLLILLGYFDVILELFEYLLSAD
jgi:hypothetical protein